MPGSLKNKKVLLGVTGSVAAYKSLDLVKGLRSEGASVSVIMTSASQRFATPLSFQLASGGLVYTDTFAEPLAHIELARQSEIFVIAPATANIIGKAANGLADDLLSTAFLAFKGSIVIAPAMNWRMYENPAYQENQERLAKRGAVIAPPARGVLACGEEGTGKMAPVAEIIEAIKKAVGPKDLDGERILVTAGPTREHIDPVRFISNRSTGKMGYAIARAAIRRGASVTLVSGPVSIAQPTGASYIPVVSAQEMRSAVMSHLDEATAIIMTAAVSDLTFEEKHKKKLDKKAIETFKLVQSPDILEELGRKKHRPMLIGFAAESGENRERARGKLEKKGADLIVLNDISAPDSGFEADTNRIIIISPKSEKEHPLMSKDDAADAVLDALLALRRSGDAG